VYDTVKVFDLGRWKIEATLGYDGKPPYYANVMGDADLEIILSEGVPDIKIYDNQYQLVDTLPNVNSVGSIVNDIDKDGLNELVEISNDGTVRAYDTYAGASNPLPRTNTNHYSERNTRTEIYISPPGTYDSPNKPSTPVGKENGKKNTEYTYSSITSDFDGDQVYYLWNWCDGTNSGWLGPYTSGVTISSTHKWTSEGLYSIKVKAKDTFGAESPWSDSLAVTISEEENNPPNTPSTPSGEAFGKTGVFYVYESSTTDSDGDQIYYLFDWSDGTDSGWIGPFNNGDICQESHIWNTKGSYSVKVKARDIHGGESDWSDPLPITMPYSYNPIIQFLELLFQRCPHAFPLLRQLAGY
jgi:hypothetical protein